MSRRIELLVADDEPEVVESISQQLEKLGKGSKIPVHVTRSFSGSDVLAILMSERIDAVIIDYNFEGGMNGEEIIEKMYDPFGQSLIIILSGHKEASLIPVITRLASRFGNRFRFLRKPVEAIELRAIYSAIRSFIDERPLVHPFSYFLQKTKIVESGMNKFWATINLLESFLKYSVAVIMADLANLSSLERIRIPIDLSKELTLGAWIRLVEAITKEYRNIEEPFIPPLRELLSQPEVFDFLWRLHNYRNDLAAHGYTVEDEWYNELLKTEENTINTFIKEIKFLSNYPLFVPEKVSLPAAEGSYEYRTRVLMGASEQFEVKKIELNYRLNLNELYAYSPRKPCLLLHPFILYHLCKECKSKKIYFLDTIKPTKFLYKSFCNHTIEIDGGITFFESRFPALQLAKSKSQ